MSLNSTEKLHLQTFERLQSPFLSASEDEISVHVGWLFLMQISGRESLMILQSSSMKVFGSLISVDTNVVIDLFIPDPNYLLSTSILVGFGFSRHKPSNPLLRF